MNIDKPEISHELAKMIQGIPNRRAFIEAAQEAKSLEEFRKRVEAGDFGKRISLY